MHRRNSCLMACNFAPHAIPPGLPFDLEFALADKRASRRSTNRTDDIGACFRSQPVSDGPVATAPGSRPCVILVGMAQDHPGENASERASLPIPHSLQSRREAPSSLKIMSGATSACPISLLHGLIHTVAASFSKNL